VVTEESLQEKIDALKGPKGKGLSLEAFDKFVDDLVAAYKVHVDSLPEESFEGRFLYHRLSVLSSIMTMTCCC
jgi:hypothetical protein